MLCLLFLQKPRNTEFYHTKKSFNLIAISVLILPFFFADFINGYTGVYNEYYGYHTVSVA